MKVLTSAFLLAIPFFISSCISCTHHREYGTITTKVVTTSGTGFFDVKKDTASKVYPTIGKVLRTKYFDVTVSKLLSTDFIKTGNNKVSQLDTDAGEGYRFLILTVKVKNRDNVNRKMFSEGVIWIYSDGIKYKYDISESVKGDGWGFIPDDIKPGISKTTQIVYKVSRDVKGAAYFQPRGANDDERISLGLI